MLIERKTIISIACSSIFAIGGFFILAWPRYKHAAATGREVESVRVRIENQEHELQSLEELARELNDREQWVVSNLRTIPRTVDMATLIGALTVEANGITVLDQTFNRGRIHDVATIEDGTLLATPLVIDMDATFDVVFDVISRVEAMRDLVRVTSLRIERHKQHPELVHATITVDAVFAVDPPPTKEKEAAGS